MNLESENLSVSNEYENSDTDSEIIELTDGLKLNLNKRKRNDLEDEHVKSMKFMFYL